MYGSIDAFRVLSLKLDEHENSLGALETGVANRLFYLAIPPSVFVESGTSIKQACQSTRGFNRVIVEKPFGNDLASSRALAKDVRFFFVCFASAHVEPRLIFVCPLRTPSAFITLRGVPGLSYRSLPRERNGSEPHRSPFR
jgi:hypothetical protein